MPTILRRPSSLRTIASAVAAIVALAALAAPAAAATETVRITDRLSPAQLTVSVGSTLRWVNADDDRHRVRSQSGPDRFDSGNLEPGESFSVRLTAAGTYRYLDERDDENRRYFGTIVVRAAGGSDGGAAGGGSGENRGGHTSAEVGMAGRSFGPASLTIPAGGTVTFRNDDDREHTVTSTTGAFDSGIIGDGGTWKRTFAEAGTFPFLCALHPEMTGEVVVEGSPAPGGAQAPAPSQPPAPKPSPTATPEPTQPATEADAVVEMRDFVFDATDLTVPAGTTVTWRNAGAAPHTATAADGSFDSGMVAAGATWATTFEAPGTFAYVCTFHPEMTGSITVAAAAAAPAPQDPQPGTQLDPQAATSRAPLPDAESLLRVAFVLLLIGGAVVLFMRTVAGAARRPA